MAFGGKNTTAFVWKNTIVIVVKKYNSRTCFYNLLFTGVFIVISVFLLLKISSWRCCQPQAVAADECCASHLCITSCPLDRSCHGSHGPQHGCRCPSPPAVGRTGLACYHDVMWRTLITSGSLQPKNLSEYAKITEIAMLRTPRTPRPRGGFLRCPLCVFKVVLPVPGRLIGVFEVSMDASFHFEWHHRRPCPTQVAGDTAVFVPFNFLLFLAAPLSMASVFLSHGLLLCRQSRHLSSQEENVKFFYPDIGTAWMSAV
jgi:hypothetical protein